MPRPPLVALLLCVCLTAALNTGCGRPAAATGEPAPSAPVATSPPNPAPPPPAPEPAPPTRARIVAVGDLLMHTPLVYSSQLSETEFDFTPLFAPIRPWLEGADLAIADLETTLTGPDYPWSGYPSFNTPPVFARDVKAVGFDAVVNANNHALDYDGPGLRKTADHLDQHGLPHIGTSRTAEESDRILLLDVAPGLKLALLSYTYGTNGVPLPQPWSVNMLDEERIRRDVRRARTTPGVDLVAVALHFGQEYARQPDAEQERWVQLTLEAGADIILGDHVHVLQKMEVRQVRDEFGRDLRRAVVFSLGNFVHNQVGLFQEEGIIFVVDVRKEKGVTTVEQVSFVPTWVHPYREQGQRRFRVVAVEQAMRAYEQGTDPTITAADYARLKEIWADVTVHVVGSPEVTLLHVDQPPDLKRGAK